ncbi:RluA family pseudouridine synthase [Alteribacillus iranensis]|uniref:Pseudouridine synthase n=1 Tax=Alteribacillus iranensis TaxID=930128 RepID=A0A1I2D016_9BACI|nr:RluA family pseudouridine synthase [Alteribacillus iranensis]SFE73878.1 23S rRNA pseudouridine1911/1915/1917 synthase [Alteribacillus iranensis]
MRTPPKLHWKVSRLSKSTKVSQYLKEEKGFSSRLIKRIKQEGAVYGNGKQMALYHHLTGGETLSVILPLSSFPEDIPVWHKKVPICWEDDHLLLVNKPAGVPMFPGRGLEAQTLAGAIKSYYERSSLSASFHAVSRLDKQTSGLVTIAKHAYAHQRLSQFFQEGRGHKRYIGITEGIWEKKRGRIEAPIGRKPDSLIEHQVDLKGKYALTEYQVLEEQEGYSYVQFELLTGRTHQIRVHSAYCGHPLLGDDLYGGNSAEMSRQALHAYELQFCHPVTETWHTVQAELPVDMRRG